MRISWLSRRIYFPSGGKGLSLVQGGKRDSLAIRIGRSPGQGKPYPILFRGLSGGHESTQKDGILNR